MKYHNKKPTRAIPNLPLERKQLFQQIAKAIEFDDINAVYERYRLQYTQEQRLFLNL